MHIPKRPHRYLTTIVLLWLAIVTVLVVFRDVLLPFGAALLIAYVAEPLVSRLSRWEVKGHRLPRWAAILTLYAGFFGAVYLFSVAALPQLYREFLRLTAEAKDFLNDLTPARIAAYSRAAEEWLSTRGIPVDFSDMGPGPSHVTAAAPDAAGLAVGADVAPEGARLRLDLAESVRNAIAGASAWLKSHIMEVVGYSQRLVAHVLGGVFMLFFVLMVAAFILLDVQAIQRFFLGLVPPEHRDGYEALLRRIDVKLSGVVRGQIVICLVNGVLTLIGLLMLDVKFALILATMATILSFIPIFGTILSTIPIVLVGLSQSFSTGVAALAWILFIHAVEAYVLNPKIMGTAAKIHPALIAFALLAGERTFGFVGALFAVPVASILIATFQHFQFRAQEMVGGPDDGALYDGENPTALHATERSGGE